MSEDCVSDTFVSSHHIFSGCHTLNAKTGQDRTENSPAVRICQTQCHIFRSIRLHPADTHTAIKKLDVNAKDYLE